jgi:hypothetical protein
MTETTNYETVAADLVGRIAKTQKKISTLDEKRSKWALDAQLGDADAKAEMNKLGDERNRLNGEIARSHRGSPPSERCHDRCRRRGCEAACREGSRYRAETAGARADHGSSGRGLRRKFQGHSNRHH